MTTPSSGPDWDKFIQPYIESRGIVDIKNDEEAKSLEEAIKALEPVNDRDFYKKNKETKSVFVSNINRSILRYDRVKDIFKQSYPELFNEKASIDSKLLDLFNKLATNKLELERLTSTLSSVETAIKDLDAIWRVTINLLKKIRHLLLEKIRLFLDVQYFRGDFETAAVLQKQYTPVERARLNRIFEQLKGSPPDNSIGDIKVNVILGYEKVLNIQEIVRAESIRQEIVRAESIRTVLVGYWFPSLVLAALSITIIARYRVENSSTTTAPSGYRPTISKSLYLTAVAGLTTACVQIGMGGLIYRFQYELPRWITYITHIWIVVLTIWGFTTKNAWVQGVGGTIVTVTGIVLIVRRFKPKVHTK